MTNFLLTVIPQADPLPLPAPPWLLRLLLVLLFFLHIIAMNFVLGGSLFAAFSSRKTADPAALAVRSWMAKLMPTIVALAVTLGVASLLFAQTLYGRVLFAGSVLMGWFWFAVIPLVIAAYYGTYLLAFRHGRIGRGASVAVAFGLAAFAAMFVAFRAGDPARGVHLALWMLGATMLVMVITRDQLREISLRSEGFRMTEWVVPQWDVIAIFFVLFVGGIATTVWMSSLLLRRRTG